MEEENDPELLDLAKIAKNENEQTNNDTKNDDDFFIETEHEEPLVQDPGIYQYYVNYFLAHNLHSKR